MLQEEGISKQFTYGIEIEYCSVVIRNTTNQKNVLSNMNTTLYNQELRDKQVLYTISRKLLLNTLESFPPLPDLKFLQKPYSPMILLVAYKDKKPYMELYFDCISSSTNLEWRTVGSGIKTRSEFFNLQLLYDIKVIIDGFKQIVDKGLYNINIAQYSEESLPDIRDFGHPVHHEISYKMTQLGIKVFKSYKVHNKRQMLGSDGQKYNPNDVSIHITNSMYVPKDQDNRDAILKYLTSLYNLQHSIDHNTLPQPIVNMQDLFRHCQNNNLLLPDVRDRNKKHAWNLKHPIDILGTKDFYLNAYLLYKVLLPESNDACETFHFIQQCDQMKSIISKHLWKANLETQYMMLSDTILFLKAKLVQIVCMVPNYIKQNDVHTKDQYCEALCTQSFKQLKDLFIQPLYNDFIIKYSKNIEQDCKNDCTQMSNKSLFSSIEQHLQDIICISNDKYVLVENRGKTSSGYSVYMKDILERIIKNTPEHRKLNCTKYFLTTNEKKKLQKCNEQWAKVEKSLNDILDTPYTAQNNDVNIVGESILEV